MSKRVTVTLELDDDTRETLVFATQEYDLQLVNPLSIADHVRDQLLAWLDVGMESAKWFIVKRVEDE